MMVCTFKIILKPKSSLRNCISFISACPLGLISNSPSNSTSAGLAYMDDAIGISAWTKPLYSPEFTHGKLYNNIYTNQAPINKTKHFCKELRAWVKWSCSMLEFQVHYFLIGWIWADYLTHPTPPCYVMLFSSINWSRFNLIRLFLLLITSCMLNN